MKIQKLISAGFAMAALASASVPALSLAISSDDPVRTPARIDETGVDVTNARPGYIWVPGHFEARGADRIFVNGHFEPMGRPRDAAALERNRVATANGVETVYATGPTVLYDSQGNVIPTSPYLYPLDSARR